MNTLSSYRWTADQILTATSGRLVRGSRRIAFSGISIDSRTIAPDQLFVAIAGEHHDGHRFVADVLKKGVRGVMVSEAKLSLLPLDRMLGSQILCICVPDTIKALGDMARFSRRRGKLCVVAITGSNGKTSTRMLTERVLSQGFSTLGTQGNFNTDIGLPLTLFRLRPDHQAAVLELGMRHPGEIAYLGRICEPNVGIITNVKISHLAPMGTIDAVAKAKAELLGTLSPDGVAILNADDPRVREMGKTFAGTVIWFGIHGCDDADVRLNVRADSIRLTDAGMTFTLITPNGSIPVTLATPSTVMVENALAAAAAGVALNLSLGQIQKGLEEFEPQPGRMGIVFLPRDILIVDDTYNANPASMAAAMETMGAIHHRGRRTLAVLGDMLELGEAAPDFHREAGKQAAENGIARLFVTGEFADAVMDGAVSGGMAASHIFCGDKAAIGDALQGEIKERDVILVKGSRAMAMEDVVADIRRRIQNA